MKKLISIALSVLCVAALFTGCAKQVSGQVATDGSTSMEKVIGALSEQFMQTKNSPLHENTELHPAHPSAALSLQQPEYSPYEK